MSVRECPLSRRLRGQSGSDRYVCETALLTLNGHDCCYGRPANGLATSCAQSMNSFAAGFNVRFFKVMIAIGIGLTGKWTGSTLNAERMAPKRMNEPGKKARYRPVGSKLFLR